MRRHEIQEGRKYVVSQDGRLVPVLVLQSRLDLQPTRSNPYECTEVVWWKVRDLNAPYRIFWVSDARLFKSDWPRSLYPKGNIRAERFIDTDADHWEFNLPDKKE